MRIRLLAVTAIAISALTACGGPSSSPTVPSLGGSRSPGGAGPTGDARKAALHAAAECIRQHGVPTYQDPVLTTDGHVYTDARSIQDAGEDTLHAVEQACGQQLAAAQLQPDEQAPAPPALVQAGVKATECLRANGLPNVKDPTSSSPFTPGHGFGLNGDDLPGDKTHPDVQRAFTACRTLLDEEVRLSSLGNLANA